MYIEKVLDLGVQFMKNGGKNKGVVFIILFSVIMLLFLQVVRKHSFVIKTIPQNVHHKIKFA